VGKEQHLIRLGAQRARLVVASIILGCIIFIFLIAYAPDSVPYSTNNYGWNGLEQVYSQYNVHPISSITAAALSQNLTRSVLIVIAPVTNFSSSESSSALKFVKGGGTLVVSDSTGTSNSLLSQMGVGIQVEVNISLYDNLYNWRAKSLPTALILPSAASAFPQILAGVSGIALNEPSPLNIISGGIAVAITSTNSYESGRSSNLLSSLQSIRPTSNASGPFTVGAIDKIGTGTLLVIGDSQFFTNPMLGLANNNALISNLFSNSTVYLDTAQWPPNTIASIKADFALIYYTISQSGLRYLFALGIVGVSIVMLPIISIFRRNDEEFGTARTTERVRDPIILERIRKERAKLNAGEDS
jgi:hypothetical protein